MIWRERRDKERDKEKKKKNIDKRKMEEKRDKQKGCVRKTEDNVTRDETE